MEDGNNRLDVEYRSGGERVWKDKDDENDDEEEDNYNNDAEYKEQEVHYQEKDKNSPTIK